MTAVQTLSDAARDFLMEDDLIMMGLGALNMVGEKTAQVVDANRQLVGSCEVLLDGVARINEFGIQVSAQSPAFATLWSPVNAAIAAVDTPELREEMQCFPDVRGAADDLFDKLAVIYCRLAFCRAVDNYLTFQLDLLKVTLKTIAESFAISAQEAGITGLDYETVAHLLAHQLEEKSNRSSRDDIEGMLTKSLGLRLYESPDTSRQVNEIVQLRNLITHRRGRVDKKAEARLSGRGYAAGDEAFPEPPQVLADMDLLRTCVLYADRQAVQKFGLSSSPAPERALASIGVEN
jgi:hypothetical protein